MSLRGIVEVETRSQYVRRVEGDIRWLNASCHTRREN